MRLNKILIKILTVFLLFVFCSNIYASQNQSKNIQFNTKIQNIVDASRLKYHLPAISVSIKLPGSTEIRNYVSGYYSLNENKRITPNVLFQIGSISKTYTASIIYQLIENNKLHMDDKLTKWLPQYPRWSKVSIYDLLHHTSGIYNYSQGSTFDNLLRTSPDKDQPLSKLADIAYGHDDLFQPGKKYNYTNTDYILLGMIIEKAGQQSLIEVFSRYLKQYGLNNTFYPSQAYPGQLINRMAHGYNRDGTFKSNTDTTSVSMSYWQSAGALIATPADLIKWLNQLFTGKIINNKSLMNMTTVISETDAQPIVLKDLCQPYKITGSKHFAEIGVGSGIGLVYFKDYGFTWAHAGGTPGYETFYAYNPCKGIYLALAYSVKPKQQLIFINISEEIFNVVDGS